MSPVKIKDTDIFYEEAADTVKSGSVLYGLPYNAWYQGVIYNKDIFQKYKLTPPTTREGLEEVVACLERKGIVPFASHFQESWEVANMTMQYMMNEIFDKMPDWGDQFRKGTKNYEGNAEVQNCFKNNQFTAELKLLFLYQGAVFSAVDRDYIDFFEKDMV